NSQLNWSAPDWTQCSTGVTLASPVPATKERKIGQLSAQLANSAPVVMIFDGTLPITRWPSPATRAASSGRKTIAWITGLPLHPVGIVDGDGAAAAEIDDDDREPDRRFAGGDGQHEHREDLPDQIAER